jgi:hypothetical protein
VTAGLVAEAAVAGGLLGKTDFATNVFDDVEDFRERYATVERSVTGVTQGRSTDLVKDIQRIQGAYQAVTALRGDVELDRSGFEVVTPSPQVTADAVLAGHPDRFDLGRLQGALTTTGWWRSHDKRLDERNGLPNPGVMVALRNLSTR